MAEDGPVVCFGAVAEVPLTQGMRRERGFDGGEHTRVVLIFVEENDRGFGIPVRRVAEKLVDGLQKSFGTGPELAFADKRVLAAGPDENVGFAGEVEGFARR